MTQRKQMTDEEVMFHIKNNSRLNRVRKILNNEIELLEVAESQRHKLVLIDRQRMEFEAVRKIVLALGVKI